MCDIFKDQTELSQLKGGQIGQLPPNAPLDPPLNSHYVIFHSLSMHGLQT